MGPERASPGRRVRVAANYSPQLMAIRREHPGLSDLVKVSEFDSHSYVADYRRLRMEDGYLLLHGLGQSLDRPGQMGRVAPGHPAFRSVFSPELLQEAVAITATPYISVHLEYPDGVAEPFVERSFLAALIQDVDYLRGFTGLEVHLENVHFYHATPGRPHQPPLLASPQFIRRALAATQARFLLDLAHVMVAASRRGESAEEHLDQLPLDLVTEVHIAGPVMIDGQLRDRHEEVGTDGFALLERVLGSTSVETVTLEYGGVGPLFEPRSDYSTLLRQLSQIRAHCAARAPES